MTEDSYFEDLQVGETFRTGTVAVTEADIVEFSSRYVPLPTHLRGETAPWLYVGCLSFRLVVDEVFGRLAFAGGWGADDLTYHRPVRPGETLSVELELVEKRPRTPDRGDGDFEVRVYASDGTEEELVLSYLDHVMVFRRSANS